MSISSPDFFILLAALFFVYWVVRGARLAAISIILFGNYFFYAKWDILYLAIVPAAATCDFLLGDLIHRSQNRAFRRLLVTASILVNVALIVSTKYIPFIGETTHHSNWSWVLPPRRETSGVVPDVHDCGQLFPYHDRGTDHAGLEAGAAVGVESFSFGGRWRARAVPDRNGARQEIPDRGFSGRPPHQSRLRPE